MARRRPRGAGETVTVSELVARTTTSRLRRWSSEALRPEDASGPDELPRHRRPEESAETGLDDLAEDTTEAPGDVTEDTVVVQAADDVAEGTGPPPDGRSRRKIFATVGVAAVVLVGMGVIMLSGPAPQSGSAPSSDTLPPPPTGQAVTTTTPARITTSLAATMNRPQEDVSSSPHANTPPRHRPASQGGTGNGPVHSTQNNFGSVISSIASNWPRGCSPPWHC